MDGSNPYLTLAEARAMISRGVAKAEELLQAGAIVVVDAGGNAVSISRMDDGPVSSVAVSRSKAYLAAVQGRPTAAFAANARERPEIFSAFQTILSRKPIPGPGGMPIFKDGRAVGGIATGGGVGPFTEVPGVDPARLVVDGAQANAEDLVICEALGIRYQSQHGDRPLRQPGPERMASSVPLPLGLTEALRLADRAITRATGAGVRVGVAVVDEIGRLIQNDRMDGSPLISCELAEAKASSALKFQRPTSGLTEEFRSHSARLRAIERILGSTILAVAGGVPITKNGRIIGAIGVSGSGAFRPSEGGESDEGIAVWALSA